jgi:hypothetical protein
MHTRALKKGDAVRVTNWRKDRCTVRYGIIDTVILPDKVCVRHRGHLKQYTVKHISRVSPMRAVLTRVSLLTVRGVTKTIIAGVRYLYHYPFPEQIDD